jgi:adenosylmethionine---8-amino-7-oxononanoate aminotransferase
MHHLFAGILPQQFFVAAPQTAFGEHPLDEAGQQQLADDVQALRSALEAHHEHLAALILEPVVQGAGGMRFYHADYLKAARQLCDEFDLLLIADEIATGFGRTGKLFACEHAGISPDIMCLGKAITGGYMTLAATLTTRQVAETISQGEAGCFMHGPTFMANPLACRIACASIDLLLADDWQAQVARLNQGLQQGLGSLAHLPQVADVRTLGAIGVVQMREAVNVRQLQPLCIEQGIWVRPFADLVYVMPPFVMNNNELVALTTGIQNAIREYIGLGSQGDELSFV